MIDILIVDDEPPMSWMLTRYYERHGYTCAAAANVAEALALIPLQPQVCILDLSIAGGEGETFITPLKAALPDCLCLVWTAVPEGARLDRVRMLDINAIVIKADINALDQIFAMLPPPRERSGETPAIAPPAASGSLDGGEMVQAVEANTAAIRSNTEAIVEASNKIDGFQG